MPQSRMSDMKKSKTRKGSEQKMAKFEPKLLDKPLTPIEAAEGLCFQG